MSDRQEEIEQYVKAYMNDDYKMGHPRRQDVYAILKGLDGTLLDVGTGRGETLDMCKKLGILCAGTEVVPYLVDQRDEVVFAESVKLPFSDNFFDHVTCFDVFEHLVEEDLIPTVHEMIRVARKSIVISASESPHNYRGRDLHISRRPKEKWRALIEKASGLKSTDRGTCGGSPCFQVHIP